MLSVDLIIVDIAFIGNVFLGLFTLLKNPKGTTNKLFFLFAFVLTVYLIVNYLASLQNTDQSAFFFVKMIMTIALFINLVFFLLSSTFPHYTFQTSRKVLWISILATVLLVFAAQANLIFVSAKAHAASGIPGVAMPLFLLHTIIYLGTGFFILVKKFRKSVGIEKVQINLFIFGAVLMFVSILVTNLLFVLILNTGAFISLLPLYILIFLGFISYAIVRHRFLDIGLVVARTVSFTLLILLSALFYGVLFAILSSLFISTPLEIKTISISALLAVIMAFSFQRVRHFLEKLTDKVFYKGKYDTNKLLYDSALIMASTLRLENLTHQFLKQILTQMRITKGAFILTDTGKIYQVIQEGYTLAQEFDTEHIKILANQGKTLLYEELDEGEVKNIMRKLNFTVIAQLNAEGKYLGLLALSLKQSGDIYTDEDLRVIEILAPEAAVAIQNAKAYEEISRFNITLKEEVEKQTKELKDLTELQKDQVDIMGHEVRTPLTSISQQLNLLLEMILTEQKREEWLKGNVQREDAKRVIEGLKKMQVAELQEDSIITNMIEAARLDKLRFELNYSTFDIIDLVKLAIKDSENRLEANKQTGHIALQSQLLALDVEADQTRIKQCIDGLLTNAEKYGRNPQTHSLDVTVSITTDNQMVSISVHDLGMGIDAQDMEKLGKKFSRLNSRGDNKLPVPGGSGLGLYTYKGIIEHHNGQLIIESEGIGKGSTFTIKLPQKRPRNS